MIRPIVIFCLFFASTASFGEMYKCKGKEGVVFQEAPCKGGKKIDIPDTPINSHESQLQNAIGLGRVVVGMTKEQVIRAWGRPTKINKTIGAGYSSEQWVYERGGIGRAQYLYFDDGILRSAQGPTE